MLTQVEAPNIIFSFEYIVINIRLLNLQSILFCSLSEKILQRFMVLKRGLVMIDSFVPEMQLEMENRPRMSNRGEK